MYSYVGACKQKQLSDTLFPVNIAAQLIMLSSYLRNTKHGYSKLNNESEAPFKTERTGRKQLFLGLLGAAAYQLGNTSSCTITEVKQR